MIPNGITSSKSTPLEPDWPAIAAAKLGRRVQAARKAAGLTQQALADRMDAPRGTLAEWERSTTLPYPTLLALIAAGLDPAILCPELTERAR